jgi:hypothetical protein
VHGAIILKRNNEKHTHDKSLDSSFNEYTSFLSSSSSKKTRHLLHRCTNGIKLDHFDSVYSGLHCSTLSSALQSHGLGGILEHCRLYKSIEGPLVACWKKKTNCNDRLFFVQVGVLSLEHFRLFQLVDHSMDPVERSQTFENPPSSSR